MIDFQALLQPHQAILEQWNISADQQKQLVLWLTKLWDQNQDLNLFSRKMVPQTLVEEHLLDSLVGLPHLPDCHRVADLGTGGGFPVIPLAICRPDIRFILFEKSILKNRYLKNLGLANIQGEGQLEPTSLDQDIDLVIARAFKPTNVILDMTRSYYQRGGRYLLYKGRRSRIDEELNEAGLPPESFRIQPLTAFGNIEERHLLLIN